MLDAMKISANPSAFKSPEDKPPRPKIFRIDFVRNFGKSAVTFVSEEGVTKNTFVAAQI